MLDEIVKNLQVLCDYKINETATLNILQAKLSYIFGFKDCKFQSIQNLNDFKPLSYYAFNFIPSGGIKNNLLSIINKNLLNFFNNYINEYNQKQKEKIETDWILKLQEIEDKVELRRKKAECEAELNRFCGLYNELTNATQSRLYTSLKLIDTANEGSINIVNTEFANFYEEAILDKDTFKKEFLNMLYDLYDGEFKTIDTTGTPRQSLYNIPTTCIFLSDYKLILENEKLSNSFKSYLARGMARRSFIYCKKDENFFLQNIKYPSYDEKMQAIENLKVYANQLENIFNQISIGKEYYFNQDTNNAINDYKVSLDEKIAKFYQYNDYLDLNTEIIKLNLEHSTWKIIKLAVIYHILENPTNSFVTVENFQKAINFFNKTHNCLKDLLTKKNVNDYDNLYNFLVKHRNEFVSKMVLRNEKFVSNRDFKFWFDDALDNVNLICETKGFKLVTRITGARNTGFEVALYEPNKYQFIPEFDGNLQKGQLIKIDHSDLDVNEI